MNLLQLPCFSLQITRWQNGCSEGISDDSQEFQDIWWRVAIQSA